METMETIDMNYLQEILEVMEMDLYRAIESSDLDEAYCIKLIKNGVDIHKCNSYGSSPLFLAAKYGYIEVVKMLLHYGANVNQCNRNNESPLFITAIKGHAEIAKLLLQLGADINKQDRYRIYPLEAAALNGHSEVVKVFLQFANENNCFIISPLMAVAAAAQHRRTEVIKVFVQNNVDLSVDFIKENKRIFTNDFRYKYSIEEPSPLHTAIIHGGYQIAKILIENGAKHNVRDDLCGFTPFLLALRTGDIELIQLLFHRGVDINEQNNYGEPPLNIAIRWGTYESVKFLVENGTDVNICDNRGRTPLHTSAASRALRGVTIAKLLIENGADIYTYDNFGVSPLILATKSYFRSIANRKYYYNTIVFLEKKLCSLNVGCNKKITHNIIDLYEILIRKIGEKTIVKNIINMKYQLEKYDDDIDIECELGISSLLDKGIKNEKILRQQEEKLRKLNVVCNKKITRDIIELYEILIEKIGERVIVKNIIEMKYQIEYYQN